MDKIKVTVMYPGDEDPKDIYLSQTELMALMLSNKMGSNTRYYQIKNKIFEDLGNVFCVSIMLEDDTDILG